LGRKNDLNKKNQDLFGNKSQGIHGGELPKFSQVKIDFWKLHPNYTENPKHFSNLLFKRSTKFWAQPDKMLLSDVNNLQYPIDPFKRNFSHIKRKEVVSTKINQTNSFSNLPDLLKENVGGNHRLGFQRYSNNVINFNSKDSIYNDDPSNRLTQQIHDLEPLYSSFSMDKIFRDPNRIGSMYF